VGGAWTGGTAVNLPGQLTNTYADAQQKVNLAIIERLREMKVSFTAPLRAVVVIENAPGTD